MAIYKIEDLADRAANHWRSYAPLRTEEALDDEVYHSTHQIPVPKTLLESGRVEKIYSQVGKEKVNRAKVLLDFPQLTVTHPSGAAVRRDQAQLVQDWLEGVMQQVELAAAARPVYGAIKEDLLLKSRAYEVIHPDYHPLTDAGAAATDDDENDEGAAGRRFALPLADQWKSAAGVVEVPDARGLAEIYIFEQLPVSQVLRDYVDEDGKPLATKLAQTVEWRDLTIDDQCWVLTRFDREHFQVAVLDQHFSDSSLAFHRSFTNYGMSEVLVEQEHGMGMVPVAFYHGRTTNSEDIAYKYDPFLRPVRSQIRALDNLLTQRNSMTRVVSWGTLVVEKAAGADPLGTAEEGDEPKEIDLPEAAAWDGLAPGEKLSPVQWTTPEGLQYLAESERPLRHSIDRHTFGEVVYGTDEASSGYHTAQLQGAAEHGLEDFRDGLAKGTIRRAHLLLRAARRFFAEMRAQGKAEQVRGIPVRYTTADGIRQVTLTPALADADWDIAASVKVKPVGGEMAYANYNSLLMQNGVIDIYEFRRRMGDRNPAQTAVNVLAQRILDSPELLADLVGAARAHLLEALTTQPPQALPPGGTLPPGLAGQLQSPEALARLGPGGQPAGGAPNPAAQTDGLAIPTPRDAKEGNVLRRGAATYGQGQSAPGGGFRQGSLLPAGGAAAPGAGGG